MTEKIEKATINTILNSERGCILHTPQGYKVLEHGWLRKLRLSGYSFNQIYYISKRDWLWVSEAKDFFKYAGVECTL